MILKAENIKKFYSNGGNTIKAVNDINISISKGDFVAIMGESGSGKTTLMNCLATTDEPDSGKIFLDHMEITNISKSKLSKIRREKIGFVFQEYNLLDNLTVEENVELALIINKWKPDQIKAKVKEVAIQLGIEDILKKYPYEISGGQKQRCACARAIIHEPVIIFADEPTGALDSRSSKTLLEVFKKMNRVWGTTILIITHDIIVGSYAKKIFILSDGKIEQEINYCGETKENYRKKIYETIMISKEAKECT